MNEKEQFLSEVFPEFLQSLKSEDQPLWGKLSSQGMIEHLSEAIANAYGKINIEKQLPEEQILKAKAFAMSDKEFKPNTQNALMSEIPAPLRNHSIQDAIQELHEELSAFFSFYQQQPNAICIHPFFGEMNYNEWVHLLHKHTLHHMKQFGYSV